MNKLDLTDYDIIVGVPCSKFKNILDYSNCIIVTREDEGVALAVGAYLSGKKPLVFVQSSGFMNTLDILTSLCKPYGIKIPLLISLRTKPEHHEFCGMITEDLLKLLRLVEGKDYFLVRE
ncbi:hypothetical protein LCGC14_0306230 [marine sediment metagenome]|uniref:Thiamine pyrophosphate enzyme N-terminal TPP-binding domain-containing protein n=1 Tax=marine sediment metagenome TaxID=412755 RepID=A0A0F9TU07_9ZZZZ